MSDKSISISQFELDNFLEEMNLLFSANDFVITMLLDSKRHELDINSDGGDYLSVLLTGKYTSLVSDFQKTIITDSTDSELDDKDSEIHKLRYQFDILKQIINEPFSKPKAKND